MPATQRNDPWGQWAQSQYNQPATGQAASSGPPTASRDQVLAQMAGGATNPGMEWIAATMGITPQEVSGYNQMQQQQQQQARATNPTAPPQNPAEALRYQFYGAQDAQQNQQDMVDRMFGYAEQAQQESSRAHEESQRRNEGLMREGMQAQREEAAATRENNMQMMRQRQAVLQRMFSLVRTGGQGSLAAAMSPLGSELGSTYQMGMQTPEQYGGYYQGMMGSPDPSSQYLGQAANLASGVQYAPPDYSAWMDPESMRSSWYLPPQTQVTQTIPNAPGATGGLSYNAPQPQQQGGGSAYDILNSFLEGYSEARGG